MKNNEATSEYVYYSAFAEVESNDVDYGMYVYDVNNAARWGASDYGMGRPDVQ